MSNPNATLDAVEDLPTVHDDATVQRLQESLDDLAQEKEQVASDLATAKTEAAAAAEKVEDLEIEQYADPEVSAQDVEAAQNRLASERDEVERLETKADRIEKAIARVQKRLASEREGAAGKRMYDAYAPVALATSTRAAAALTEALEALAAMNALRAKAKANHVRQTTDFDLPAFSYPTKPLTNRNNDTVEDALRYALEHAEGPIEDLQERLTPSEDS